MIPPLECASVFQALFGNEEDLILPPSSNSFDPLQHITMPMSETVQVYSSRNRLTGTTRTVRLDSKTLSIFKDQQCTKLKSQLSLTSIACIFSIKKNGCCSVITTRKKIMLKFNNMSRMALWMLAIDHQIISKGLHSCILNHEKKAVMKFLQDEDEQQRRQQQKEQH